VIEFCISESNVKVFFLHLDSHLLRSESGPQNKSRSHTDGERPNDVMPFNPLICDTPIPKLACLYILNEK